jgi:DNA-binding NarL/FixJ family response regulator
MTTLSIMVADDNDGMRRGLKELLEAQPGWQVVGEAANGLEAVEKAAKLAPEVVILDISMPGLDGIGAAPLIRQAVPQAELVVLSQHDASETVTRALAAGSRAYVLKSAASRDLVAAVEAVRKHESFLSVEVAGVGPIMPGGGGISGETGIDGGPDPVGPKDALN